MFKFDFLEKCLGIVSPLHFENDFSRKIVLMFYSFNLRYWARCVLQLFVNQTVTS